MWCVEWRRKDDGHDREEKDVGDINGEWQNYYPTPFCFDFESEDWVGTKLLVGHSPHNWALSGAYLCTYVDKTKQNFKTYLTKNSKNVLILLNYAKHYASTIDKT